MQIVRRPGWGMFSVGRAGSYRALVTPPADDPTPGGDPVDSMSPAERAVGAMLSEAHNTAAHQLPAMARRHVAAFGGKDAVCYVADLQQTELVPFLEPDGPGTGEFVESLNIDSTLAGRAYQQGQVLVQQGSGPDSTVWLPLLDGTERLGVLAVTVVRDVADELAQEPGVAVLRRFASLLGELIMTKTLYGDTIVRLRRQSSMGLAAEMQWSLLPPLTFSCREVTVTAALEPAYEVAGDTFDYAVDAGTAKVAVFDGMGHGLQSAQLAAMAVSAYRHSRRAGRSLIATCREVDEALLQTFPGAPFTTAVLAELDTGAGVLRWINAGHPEPLLLRQGRLVKTLTAKPRPPLGMHLPKPSGGASVLTPTIGSEQLEPGDCVLLYTDGVTEARSPDGDFFGEQRLGDLIVRNLAAGLPPPETMRRVVRALLDHQQGRLTDDASLALIQWQPEPTGM